MKEVFPIGDTMWKGPEVSGQKDLMGREKGLAEPNISAACSEVPGMVLNLSDQSGRGVRGTS